MRPAFLLARCYACAPGPPLTKMLNHIKSLRRVVITGIGCVTPIGIGREAFWSGLHRGESGVRRIESFDVSQSPVKIAAQVQDFDWEAQLGPKDRKHVPRTVPLALAAAREAFADAGISTTDLSIEERQRIGVQRHRRWRIALRRTALRDLVSGRLAFQGQRLHYSRGHARHLVERAVDGLR